MRCSNRSCWSIGLGEKKSASAIRVCSGKMLTLSKNSFLYQRIGARGRKLLLKGNRMGGVEILTSKLGLFGVFLSLLLIYEIKMHASILLVEFRSSSILYSTIVFTELFGMLFSCFNLTIWGCLCTKARCSSVNL